MLRLEVTPDGFKAIASTRARWSDVNEIKLVRILPLTPWWSVHCGIGYPVWFLDEIINEPRFVELGGPGATAFKERAKASKGG